MAMVSEKSPAWPVSPHPEAYAIKQPSIINQSSTEVPDSIATTTSAAYSPSSLDTDVAADVTHPAHLMSKNEVSFTPRRTKAPPRAWERRPAVPFTQRNDGQKIWKRVPLGEIGVETTKEVSGIGEERDRADYVRTVKRLKIDPTGSTVESGDMQEPHEEVENTSDKENTEKFSRTNGAAQKSTSKENFSFAFIATKSEENVIEAGASPRKKVRTHDAPIHAESTEVGQLQGNNVLSAALHVVRDGQEGDNNSTRDLSETETKEDILIDSENIKTTPITVEISSNTDGIAESHVQAEPASDDILTASEGTNLSEVHFSFDIAPTSQPAPVVALESSKDHDAKDEELFVEHDDGSATSAGNMLLERQSMDKEDELPMPESNADRGLGDDSTDGAMKPSNEKSLSLSARRVEDDDTAFLHDFLSRAKAQRAAREIEAQTAPQQQPTTETVDSFDQQLVAEETSERTQSSTDFALSETHRLMSDDPATEQDLTMSPLRRSSRTATVRSTAQAGRNKTLPNPIQLKRANGNEFIFTANKAQGAANIALLTRSNTKRNRGTASSVGERLRQLNVQRDESSQQSSDSASCVDTTISADSTSSKMNTAKKRKREKGDTAAVAKGKKALRWNEEELIRYREPSPTKWTEDEEPERSVVTHEVNSEAQVAIQALKSSMNEPLELPNPEAPAQSEEGLKSKVRRVRRGVAGSVNGTPAPKKRSRDFLDPNDEEDTTTTQLSSASSDEVVVAAAPPVAEKPTTGILPAVAPTTRKSRMPVPVATPAKQAKPGETAKLGLSRSIQTQAVVEDRSGTSTASSSAGRRRLRMRG